MKVAVYNQEGKETGEISLPKEIFEVAMNSDLVHQVVVSQQSNMRQGSAHTQTRGEVRGGGRKPWRQKGTGRARHGSTRSPIWKGGGVSGGPRNDRNFKREIPKQMKKKALFMVLSEKAKGNLLVVLESLKMDKPKTKLAEVLMKKLPLAKASRLVLYSDGNNQAYLSVRNMKNTGVEQARNLNIVDLLNYKYLLVSKDSLQELEHTFLNKEPKVKKVKKEEEPLPVAQ